jgi:phospholipid/cholesterol/gamma-HCH transport system permease protein
MTLAGLASADGTPTKAPGAWYEVRSDAETLRLTVGGAWIRTEARRLDAPMRALKAGGHRLVQIDCGAIQQLDTVGAWLLLRTKRSLEHEGAIVEPVSVAPEYHALVHTIDHECRAQPVVLPPRHGLSALLERLGRGFVHSLRQGYGLLGFFGLVVVELGRTLRQPRRLRVAAVVRQMEETGINAMPIVGLLSLLIGVVFAYQGASQLHRFGVDILTVNLVAIGVLRELGGMMAAIISAGRSGSAFAAQIGTMKLNEEVDAIEVGGFNLTEVLILPRLIGLTLMLPLLTFFANMAGLLGGALTCHFGLGIPIPAFLEQLRSAVTWPTFWMGLIKAPVFAVIIGLVGCHQGFEADRNAASLGRHTTQAVVESIFLVLVADALFSVLFTSLGF